MESENVFILMQLFYDMDPVLLIMWLQMTFVSFVSLWKIITC